MLKSISFQKMLPFLLVCFVSFGCNLFSESGNTNKEIVIGQPVEFESWSGNTTLPPPGQYETTIHGKINPGSIAIHYSNLYKGKTVEKDFELTGADYQACVRMIQNTHLTKEEPTTGGGSSGVELIDGAGKSNSGEPSNKDEWKAFERKIMEK